MRSILAATVLTAVALSGTACSGRSTGESAADCAFVVRWQGRVYSTVGEQRRTPEPGAALGDGLLPGCDDGRGKDPDEHVALYTLPGYDPTVAVLGPDGRVLLDQRHPEPPAKLRALWTQVPCRLRGAETVRATALGIYGQQPAPYRLDVAIDAGAGSAAEGYRQVQLRVRVEPGSPGADDRELVVEQGLWHAVPLEIRLACDGDRYVATAITRAG